MPSKILSNTEIFPAKKKPGTYRKFSRSLPNPLNNPPSHTPKPPLESYIEKKVCEYARSLGCVVYKFTSPNQRSVPDRIIIAPGGAVGWLELKRKGEKPTKLQAIEHEKLRAVGATVDWVDNIFDGKGFVNALLRKGAPVMVNETPPTGHWIMPDSKPGQPLGRNEVQVANGGLW